MINAILTGVLNVVISIMNLVLGIFDPIIEQTLPELDSGLVAISQMFEIVNNGVAFVLDISGLSDTAISLIIGYFVFVLTVPLTFSSVKLALKWYNSLKI